MEYPMSKRPIKGAKRKPSESYLYNFMMQERMRRQLAKVAARDGLHMSQVVRAAVAEYLAVHG